MELRALLERAGGRAALRLAGEGSPAELETFARDLLAGEGGEGDEAEEKPGPAERLPQQRRARLHRGGGGRAPWRGCALLLALIRAASLEQPREKRRLREILRDLRAQLPAAPKPAVVGVVLLHAPAHPLHRDPEAARLQLEGLLRRVFGQRRRSDPELADTLQAVAYRPGDGREAREAACRALRAALKLRADAVQDLEGAMALTNIAPNGKCEEVSEALDT